jgi:hypothetical protein
MKLLEFITYCEVAGFVTSHKKAEGNWEHNVEHFDIGIENGKYKVGIRYGILQEQGVIISFTLHEYTISPFAGPGIQSYPEASLKQIIGAILENEIA